MTTEERNIEYLLNRIDSLEKENQLLKELNNSKELNSKELNSKELDSKELDDSSKQEDRIVLPKTKKSKSEYYNSIGNLVSDKTEYKSDYTTNWWCR